MAIIKVGSVITKLSGKLGGTVLSAVGQNSRIAVFSSRKIPSSTRSQRNKASIQVISKFWRTIPEAHRQEWLQAFEKGKYKNLSGKGYCLSAFAYFKRYTYPFYYALGNTGTPRPSQFSFAYPRSISGAYNRMTDTLTITATPGYPTINNTVFLWVSKAVPSSRWRPTLPYYFAASQQIASGSNFVFANCYGLAFGGLPPVGYSFSAKFIGIMFQQGNFPIYLPIQITVV